MLFKKKHKIMVFLPRRGGRKLLFTAQVKDESEIQEVVLRELEKYQDDSDIKGYKYIIALDTATNTEVKIDNPYFEVSDVEVSGRVKKMPNPDEIMSLAYLEIIDKLSEAYSQTLPKVISKTTDITINTIQHLIEGMATEKVRGSQIRDLAQLVSGIVDLAKNWDKVKAMSQDIAPQIMALMKGEPPAGVPAGAPVVVPAVEVKGEGKGEAKSNVKGEVKGK